MNISLSNINLFPVMLALAASVLSGCLRDGADDVSPVVPPGKADGITMSLSVPGMQTVTRGTVPETAIDRLDVLVFNSDDRFVEYARARVIATELGGGSITQAFFPVSSGRKDFSLVVLANAGRFVALKSGSWKTGVSKSSIINSFAISQDIGDVLWNSGSSYDELMPMYGESALISEIPSTDSYIGVEMTRSLARMDFTMEDTDSDIGEITLMNFKDASTIGPNTGNLIVVGNFDYVYSSGAPFRSAVREMYVHEQDRPGDSSAEEYEKSPHLVIKAKYEGVYYYYRIDFVYDGSIGGTTAGEYMRVKKNHRYDVIIKSVTSPGYATAAEATAARGEVNNLKYTIHTYDEGDSQKKHVVYDGNYYLSVDNTEFTVSKSGRISGSCLEVALETNYKTSQTDGWFVSEADASFSAYGVGSMTDFSGAAFAEGKVRFNVDPNPTDRDRMLTFTVSAGKLSQTITVTQKGTPVTASINATVLPSEILYHSFNGKLIEQGKSQIMLEWTSVDNAVQVQSVVETSPAHVTFQPFAFSTAAGYDDLAVEASYTGQKKLFNIYPRSVPTVYYSYPLRSTINAEAVGDNAVVKHQIPVKHKNFYAYHSNPGYAYVASEKLEQTLGLGSNTRFTLEMVSDPKGLARSPYTMGSSISADNYNNPFDHEWGSGYGYTARFNTKTVADIGAGHSAIGMRLSSKPYAEYDGEIVQEFDMIVVPVGDYANSYVIKPGEYAPGIPISQANRTTELGPDWINVTKTVTPVIEWSDSPGVVALCPTNPVRYTPSSYAGEKEAYLVLKGLKEGNAVVSVKQDGVVKWSWHIWVTPDRDIIEAGTGPVNAWMDRNMGAYQVTHNGELSFRAAGMRYIWGRKDPLPIQDIYYAGGITQKPYDKSMRVSSLSSVSETVKQPLVYGRQGWSGSAGEDSWGGISGAKTVYDPCPPGWKVPDFSVYETLSEAEFTFDSYGATMPGLHFPITGSRAAASNDDEEVSNFIINFSRLYTTQRSSENTSRNFMFDYKGFLNNTVDANVYISYQSNLRCIRD